MPEARRLEKLERARGLKLVNDRLAGRLVEAAAVERHFATLVVAARNKSRGLPSRLERQAPSLTVKDLELLLALIDEVLVELADGAP